MNKEQQTQTKTRWDPTRQNRSLGPSQRSALGNVNPQPAELQRRLGNQGAQVWLAEHGSAKVGPQIFAKLTIGQPNDKYEQEADWVAEQVMKIPEPTVQRVCPVGEQEMRRQPLEEGEEKIQTKPIAEQITPLVQRQIRLEEEEELIQTITTGAVTPEATPSISSRIQSLRGGGRPLSQVERGFFEPRFGADFTDVRLHDDSRAADVARSVNARAFTFGQDVVFGSGKYSPDAIAGRELLAHELTHVVQQNKKSRQIPDIQMSFEEVRAELIRMPSPNDTRDPAERRQRRSALVQRRARLMAALTRISSEEAEELYERLRIRRRGDSLSETFHDYLSHEMGGTIDEALELLQSRLPTRITFEDEGMEAIHRSVDISTFIGLVQRVEGRHGGYPIDILKRLRNTVHQGEYGEGIFSIYLGSYPGVSAGGSLTEDDVQVLSNLHNVSTRYGALDVGHVLAGMEANIRASAPPPIRGELLQVPGGPAPGTALTWSGDVGSALVNWLESSRPDLSNRQQYFESFARRDDLIGDIDAIVISSLPITVYTRGEHRSRYYTLSSLLRNYYLGQAGRGAPQRFTRFCIASGFELEESGAEVRLSDNAREIIREQITRFSRWALLQRGSTPTIPDEDLEFFVNRFVQFIERGLQEESPGNE